MSKTEITFEQAMEASNQKKEDLKNAKAELKAFRKENKLRPDDLPEDEKLAKKLAKMEANVEKAEQAYTEAAEAAKALRPAVSRPSKYEYPSDMTAAEKKKFRAKARAEKRKAEKGDEPKPEKVKKVKAEATTEEAPVKKVKKAPVEEED